jgi:5-methylcytosine-specific restriction endonuclease McrA
MAQPQRRARFFVAPDGLVIEKAKPLKRAEAYRVYQESSKQCGLCGCSVDFGGKWIDYIYSRRETRPGHVDHILARSRGGQNDRTNLRVLCMSCNCQRGAA